MTPANLRDLVVTALDDGKGQDILALDVSEASSITDFMVLVSGTSSRHVKSLVDHVVRHAKARGRSPLGVEGGRDLDWVLVDLGDVLVHVMQDEARRASMTLSASGPCRRSNSPRNCFSSCAISSAPWVSASLRGSRRDSRNMPDGFAGSIAWSSPPYRPPIAKISAGWQRGRLGRPRACARQRLRGLPWS